MQTANFLDPNAVSIFHSREKVDVSFGNASMRMSETTKALGTDDNSCI